MILALARRRLVAAFLVVTPLLGVSSLSPISPAGPSPLPHNVHVTRGRIAIESSVAVARINFFRHDLEAALAAFHKKDGLSLDESPYADSLFLAYFDDRFSLLSFGAPVTPEILRSGEAKDLWWYELQFVDRRDIDSVTVRDELLFELYDDQKHFLKLSFFPEGGSRDLYFVPGASVYNVTR